VGRGVERSGREGEGLKRFGEMGAGLTSACNGGRETSFSSFHQWVRAAPLMRDVRPTLRERDKMNEADAESKKRQMRSDKLNRGAV
jgi:hypothetical protein